MDPKRVARLNAKVPELIGNNEVAELLGVAPGNLDRVAGLPAPAKELPRGRLWRADVIAEFVAERRAAG